PLPIASRRRIAGPMPRSAWMRMSSRSSSEVASSLRLAKMSTMPRPIVEDERASPEVRRDSQPRRAASGAGAAGVAALRPNQRPIPVGLAHGGSGAGGGSGAAMAGAGGRGAGISSRGSGGAAEPPNSRRNSPAFGLSSDLSSTPCAPCRPQGGPQRACYIAFMTPEDILARVLYRDGLVLVINKPHGIAVHRGPKGGASLEDDFEALRFGLPRNPALAHRLDRETSGCLVLGRHHKALEKLGKLFKAGRIGKTYWAIVERG